MNESASHTTLNGLCLKLRRDLPNGHFVELDWVIAGQNPPDWNEVMPRLIQRLDTMAHHEMVAHPQP